MDTVRIGIVGLGGIGAYHLGLLTKDGGVKRAELAAASDVRPERLEWARQQKPGLHCFESAEALMDSGTVDAVLIATPHYHHPPLAIHAFGRGLHVLTEKPAGVYTKHVREMNRAAVKSGKVFAIMFNLRTFESYRKIKDLVASGELGELRRITWIATDWFRTQNYYDSGGWRATWAGEGGGVLLNQCPHNLDLWQWICGMPARIRAFCYFGKYHNIEVEDEVTAYGEYANGATAVFVTSTAEAPGTNRFEIAGDRGRVVLERGSLTYHRNRVPAQEFLKTSPKGFAMPECWEIKLPCGEGELHKGITQNWVNAILDGEPLISPGVEGLNSLELSNAMLLSAWTDAWVNLPIDDDAYYAALQERIRTSRFTKKAGPDKVSDIKESFR